MASFNREDLESKKYQDIVKLAKENDVYRRYAPKAELVEKLLALGGSDNVSMIEDVTMPSFSEDEGTGSEDAPSKMKREGTFNVEVSTVKSPGNGRKMRRQRTFDVDETSKNSPKMKRQRTFEVEESQKLKRQATFDIDETSGSGPKLQRQGTFDKTPENGRKLSRQGTFDKTPENRGKLRRQGTFDVSEMPSNSQKSKREGTFDMDKPTAGIPMLKREGTFDIEDNSTDTKESSIKTKKQQTKPETKQLSQLKKTTRVSFSSPQSQTSRALGVMTPRNKSFGGRQSLLRSEPRSFITSRANPGKRLKPPAAVITPKVKSPVDRRASLKRTPCSVVKEIELKRAVVSAKKIAENICPAPKTGPRKAPDFNAIHAKLFKNMESLVDSKQKIIVKANSVQKNVPKCAQRGQISSNIQKGPVARKLLSPKQVSKQIKSRLPSPKPVCLKENMISGIRRLASPKIITSLGTSPKAITTFGTPSAPSKGAPPRNSGNRFGFRNPVNANIARKDTLKMEVASKKPVGRENATVKSRQVLHNVRLNKRFELQMQHRMQQKS